jgi:hypothetical protein
MFMPYMHLLPSCKWPPLGHIKTLCLAVVLLMPFQDFLLVLTMDHGQTMVHGIEQLSSMHSRLTIQGTSKCHSARA